MIATEWQMISPHRPVPSSFQSSPVARLFCHRCFFACVNWKYRYSYHYNMLDLHDTSCFPWHCWRWQIRCWCLYWMFSVVSLVHNTNIQRSKWYRVVLTLNITSLKLFSLFLQSYLNCVQHQASARWTPTVRMAVTAQTIKHAWSIFTTTATPTCAGSATPVCASVFFWHNWWANGAAWIVL